MNGLDLFSGIGGLTLALSGWVEPVAYCDNDRFAQAVLLSRIANGCLPRAPIWDDVTTISGDMLPEIDIIYGGFPCQDISCAGLGAGLEGKRSGLFFEVIRLAKETSAPFVFLENVPAIRTRGLREIVRAFANIGYDCRWACLSAGEFGAPHRRKRWFLLAHSSSKGLERPREPGDVNSAVSQKRVTPTTASCSISAWDKSFGELVRVDDGLPPWVDRVKSLGNSVVPQQAREAFMILSGLKLTAERASLPESVKRVIEDARYAAFKAFPHCSAKKL